MHQSFQLLDHFLLSYQSLWRFEPFHACSNDASLWLDEYPDLSLWLDGLSRSDIEMFKSDDKALLEAVAHFIPETCIASQLTQLSEATQSLLILDRNLEVGVPGRKLAQIKSMSAAALSEHKGEEWLEWCAGKGFLGRILSQQSKEKVTSFEWQQSLCDSGTAAANQQALNMQFIQGDAFSTDASQVFNCKQHAVALHACGDLHVRLLELATQNQLPAITFSPCCYHLIRSDEYQAMSILAKQSSLKLTQSELRIPLQETVTGGERVKRHRQLEMTYRLGLNHMLVNELHQTEYCPIPSIKKSQLSEGFEAFCKWAIDAKNFDIPKVDFDHYMRVGETLFWKMEKLSLVQQIFRRPLELWLAYDKALYLEEKGYDVSIKTFCNKQVSPRNILVHAQKR